jgi:hypothetical protein
MTDSELIETNIREKLVGIVPPEQEQQMACEINELAKVLITAFKTKKKA